MDIDIKIYAIVGVILILALGYFVYLIYQDLIFLKKDIEGRTNDVDEEDIDEENEGIDYIQEWEDEDGEDGQLEEHLETLVEEEEPVFIVKEEPPKQRKPRKQKKVEFQESSIEELPSASEVLPSVSEQ